MFRAFETRRPQAVAHVATGSAVAVMPVTDVSVLVLRRLEDVGLELIGILIGLIGLIGRLPVGDWKTTEANR
jgi:hypothetical protein